MIPGSEDNYRTTLAHTVMQPAAKKYVGDNHNHLAYLLPYFDGRMLHPVVGYRVKHYFLFFLLSPLCLRTESTLGPYKLRLALLILDRIATRGIVYFEGLKIAV
jgi:hypothetical protein